MEASAFSSPQFVFERQHLMAYGKFLAVSTLAAGLMTAGAALAQPNPDARATELGRNNPCADPWLSYAVSVAKTAPGGPPGRATTSNGRDQECDVARYNGGHWNSYAELLGYVRGRIAPALAPSQARVPSVQGPAVVGRNGASGIISNDGGSLVGNSGGTLVGNAGGTLKPR
jgi:hypothetical protein